MGGYENLNEIDPAFVLACLTGGLVLRFNPTLTNERESIEYYINHFSSLRNDEKILIATVGSEMLKNNETKEIADQVRKKDGHSFSLIDIIQLDGNIYFKIRNSQLEMKINIKLTNK